MSDAKKCDFCGEFFIPHMYTYKIENCNKIYKPSVIAFGNINKDICPKCIKKMFVVFNGINGLELLEKGNE